MSFVSSNMKFLRKQHGYTQEQLAEKLGIKRSLVGAYEEGRADPRLSNLTNMAQVFNTTVDLLINSDIATIDESDFNSTGVHRGGDVLAITVDSEGRQNIELIPDKAAAGYTSGYSDPEYLKELPRFSLPFLPRHGTYRAFEINGDSMLPLLSGTIIIGEYVENLNYIKSGKTYVVVTRDDGIVYKRVFNYIDENGKLFLVSDNRQYEPYQLNADDVLEAWESKAYISIQFPDVKSDPDVSVEQLTQMVMDLKQEVVRLKDR